ncbi:MAG: tetratricopeptide repeat protein [Deltaproteobacteria bacterium]|nr:tetratricopeptide repeat protein [Deltaproteobacteria bacterium]
MRSKVLSTVVVLLAAGLPVSAPRVHAAPPSDAAKEARSQYEKGQTAYNLGRFDEAITHFSKGYEIKPDPVFLYNIAQSFRQIGNLERAIFFYKRFVSTAPDAPNRSDVEKKIADLEAQLKKELSEKAASEKAAADKAAAEKASSEKLATEKAVTERLAAERAAAEAMAARVAAERVAAEQAAARAAAERAMAERAAVERSATEGGTTPAQGTGPKDTGKLVAQVDSRGSSIGGGATGADVTARAAIPQKPLTFRFRVETGPTVIDLGQKFVEAELNEFPQPWFPFGLGGIYTLRFGKVGIDLGGFGSMVLIPYDLFKSGSETPDEQQMSFLFNLFGTVGVRYPIFSRLDVHAEAGVGGQWWAGLKDGNPFTRDRIAAAGGPIWMLGFHGSLGLDYHVGGGFVISLSPGFTTAKRRGNDLHEDIPGVKQAGVMLGLGYAL